MPDLLQTIPEPDAIPLPGPPGLLRFLLLLTFFLHLLPMNLVLGGSLLGGVTEALGRRGNRPHHRELARWLSRAMPAAIAATITLGVAPLLMLQGLYGRLFFTSSILMARPWLAIVPILILAYYGAYLRALGGDRLGRLGPAVGWGSTLMFVAIGFLFSNNMSLMLRPAEFRRLYLEDGRGWHLDAGDPALIPRYLHFLIGSVAVTGMFVVLLGILRRRREPEFGDWAIRYGSAWFAHPTALNIFVGILWLVLLPRETMLRFLGGDPLATVVFASGATLAFVAMMLMFHAAKAKEPAGLAKAGIATLAAVLAAMAFNRDQARQAALEAAGFWTAPVSVPQWGPILLFLVLLVAALGTIGWMLAALRRPAGSGPGPSGAGSGPGDAG